MDDKQKYKILKILWIITSIIILISATYLLVYGDITDKTVGIIGYLLLIIEAVLYYKGKILH